MKKFTVVFPLCKSGDTIFILLGEQPLGRPLAGYVNGYGGKVEDGENIEDAAKRELQEELGLQANNITQIGTVFHGKKEIVFFITEIEKRTYGNSVEMINNTWHDLADDSFVSKMIPGDNVLVHHIRGLALRFFNKELFQLFTIHKEGKEIHEATQVLDNPLRFLK